MGQLFPYNSKNITYLPGSTNSVLCCEQCISLLFNTIRFVSWLVYWTSRVCGLVSLPRPLAVATEGRNWERKKSGLHWLSYSIACHLSPINNLAEPLTFFFSQTFWCTSFDFHQMVSGFISINAFHFSGSSMLS